MKPSSSIVGLIVGLVAASSTLAQETGKLSPGALQAEDRFGSAVVLSGGVALVSAPSDFAVPTPLGPAAYALDPTTGQVLQTFTQPGPDRASQSLAAGGDLVVIGSAPGNRVTLFSQSTGQLLWSLSSPYGTQRQFGATLATDGQRVWIGEPGPIFGEGKVYEVDAATGQIVHELDPAPSAGITRRFGSGLVVTGTTLAAGIAPHLDQPPANYRGRVQVFETVGYTLLHELSSPTSQPGDRFGAVLATDGQRLLVGAPNDSTQLAESGAAFLFDLASGELLRTFYPQQPEAEGRFGSAVALEGTLAVVGEALADTSQTASGAVSVFDAETGLLRRRLVGSDVGSADRFGQAVALDQGQLLVGAPMHDAQAQNAGAAYTFDLAAYTPADPQCADGGCPCGNDDPGAGCANATGQGAALLAWGTASVALDNLSFRSHRLPPNQFSLLFMGDAQASSPLANGLLCVGDSLYRFGGAVQADGAGTVEHGAGKAFYSSIFFGPAGTITAGSTWTFQTWYRDPAGPCGATSNTTNGLRVTFTP